MNIDQNSISQFFASQIKQNLCGNQNTLEPNDLSFKGRWKQEQCRLYAQFSLYKICELHKQDRNLISFKAHRRTYSSYDRQFVEFLKRKKCLQQHPTPEEENQLCKRAKSRFNTLKRRYKNILVHKCSDQKQALDFPQMIYQQAKEIYQKSKCQELKRAIETYELLEQKKPIQNPKKEVRNLRSKSQLSTIQDNRVNQQIENGISKN